MRILYHHRTQGRGAEGNHIASIVTSLRSLGCEVDILSPPGIDPLDESESLPSDENRTKSRGWSATWKLVSRRMPRWLFEFAEIFYNVPAWFRIRKALKRKPYDVVFERYAAYLISGAVAARLAGCTFILEVNDVSGVADRVRPQIFPRVCAWVERRLLARCDLVHTVSSYLGDRVVEIGLPTEKLVVAANGFDSQSIRLTRNRNEIRRELGLNDNIVLGFAGWFVDWDRLDFLVQVFADARTECPSLKLCLVGDGDPMSEVKRMLTDLSLDKEFIHTGAVPRSQVYNYIQSFDIGILPHSNLFGSPMIMFEMMGLKIPVIAPKLPPIEDVQTHGETALLFEPLDRENCKNQIVCLAKSPDLRASLAEASYMKLTSDHTWKRTAEKILSALRVRLAQRNASA